MSEQPSVPKTATDRRRGAAKPADWKPTGLARISVEADHRAALAACTCGWEKLHKRKKVVEDAAESHVQRRHGGAAIWV